MIGDLMMAAVVIGGGYFVLTSMKSGGLGGIGGGGGPTEPLGPSADCKTECQKEPDVRDPSCDCANIVVPEAASLDAKFKLSKDCNTVISNDLIFGGKGECIKAGDKHGVVITLKDKRRCTFKCSSVKSWTSSQRKKLKIDKCKCTAANRAELEAALAASSNYARAYMVYAHNIPNRIVLPRVLN